MAEAELIEQLRAQVMSLKTPRNATPEGGTTDTMSSGFGVRSFRRPVARVYDRSGSRGRITANTSGALSTGTTRSLTRPASANETETTRTDVTVALNVGGKLFRTTQHTLRSVDGSYLALMCDGVTDSIKTSEGHFFIDRNGGLFEYVLEYLRGVGHRDMEVSPLPVEMERLKALKREAAYYRLPELVSRIESSLHEGQKRMDRDNDADSTTSVIVRETENSGEKEMDVVFQSIGSNHCHFTEDRIQELMHRVNCTLAIKQSEGFKIKSSSSDVICDTTRDPPFMLFMHVVLIRDKCRDSQGFSPTERVRVTSTPQLYHTSSFPSTSVTYDRHGGNDGMEFMGTPRSRRIGTTFNPLEEPANPGVRYSPTNGLEIGPETFLASTEYRTEGHRHTRGNYRPRFAEPPEWEYSPEPQTASPKGAGRYSPPSMMQRKHSGRVHTSTRHLESPNKYEVMEGTGRHTKRDAWVKHALQN